MGRTRRGLLRAGLAAGVGMAGCVGPFDDSSDERRPPEGSPAVDALGLETVAEGFTSPIAFADPPGDHRYVVDQAGTIEVLGRDATLLDLGDRMADHHREMGLLGVAFHPDYPDTPRVYLRYSAPNSLETPDAYSHTFALAEFEVRSDGLGVESGSERTILEIPQPQGNHNAGAVEFGPDGYLYVAVGDGGGARDQGMGHVENDRYDGSGGNGQDVTENLLGSILRIDVDERGGETPYGIPGDNPLLGEAGLDEHYAWGLRNPWGMSFADGDLIVADVGQNTYEEVNVVEKGENYGWSIREGRGCFPPDTASCPAEDPVGGPLRDPVVEYPHGGPAPSGVAVVGGYVSDGDALPELKGKYVFGDYQPDGTLFVAEPDGGSPWPVSAVDVTPGSALTNLLSFGRDRDGELYVLTSQRGDSSGNSGAIHRIVPA